MLYFYCCIFTHDFFSELSFLFFSFPAIDGRPLWHVTNFAMLARFSPQHARILGKPMAPKSNLYFLYGIHLCYENIVYHFLMFSALKMEHSHKIINWNSKTAQSKNVKPTKNIRPKLLNAEILYYIDRSFFIHTCGNKELNEKFTRFMNFHKKWTYQWIWAQLLVCLISAGLLSTVQLTVISQFGFYSGISHTCNTLQTHRIHRILRYIKNGRVRLYCSYLLWKIHTVGPMIEATGAVRI